MAIKLISAISTKEHIQFQNSSGTNTGKIESVGDNLVITNAVGDVLFGDTDSDIYIGDGVNSIDIIFEQSGAIRAETGSSVALALGSSDTTLNVYNPQIANGMTLTSTMTMGTGSAIDFLPDTGVFLKFDGQTILERKTANGAITLGHDDSIIIAGGDMSNSMNTNINNAEETVFIGAEGGVKLYGFPNNDSGGWSARSQFLFSNDGKMYFGTAVDTNLYRSAANTLKTDDKLIVGGDATFAANITKQGGGAILKLNVSSWTAEPNHDVLYNGWSSSLNDYVYLKASGNSTGGHGAAIIGDSGFYVGRTNSESGAMVDSATAPLDADVWFYATPSKFVVNDNLEVAGSVLLGGASNNSGKADFAVNVGGSDGAALSFSGTQVQVGGQDINYTFRLDSSGGHGRIKSWAGNIVLSTDESVSATSRRDIILTPKAGGAAATEAVRIKGGGVVQIHNLDAGIVQSDSSGNLSIDTSSYLTAETFGSSDVVLSLSGDDVAAGESITLAGGLSYSGTTLTSANDNTTYTAGTGLTLTGTAFSVTANTYAAASHNHTSLTGITSLSFAAQSSDAASITTTISGTGTYFDFNLTDDNNNDWWRWRFTPTGSTVYDAMVLKPISNGNANLIVSGNVTADNLSGSSSGTNTGDQTLPTLSSLGGLPLAGGTMTGTLTGTIGNFAGLGSFGEMITIDITDISTGENRGLKLLNSSGVDQQWNVTAGQTGVDNDKFTIRDATNNVDALTIAVNGGTTTLAGNLIVGGGDIVISGTGRIQGIDTVSANTDAANKTYVDTAIANLVDSSPAALNTLNELAAALGDDASFSTTVTTSIATKLPLAGGAMTGDIDMAAGTGITFYGNGSGDHGIFGRNSAGTASDDIRINSYHNVHINLDSNSNNGSSDTFFTIGQHGGTGTLGSNVFTVDGSGNVVASGTMGASNLSGTNTGDQTLPTLSSLGALSTSGGTMTGDLTIPSKIIHSGDTNTYIQFHAADQWRVVTAGVERVEVNSGGLTVNGGVTASSATISGRISAGGKLTYTKSAGSLNTTGYDVAGLTVGGNGSSAGFIFTCFGNSGAYQRIVYSCWNTSGTTWNVEKVIDEGTNHMDITVSASGSERTFTFVSRSGSLNYTPRVTVEATGQSINNTYA